MDETTKAIINRITVRYDRPTRIPSGVECTVFYDCLRLSPADLARLAAEATGDLRDDTFEVAVGIAYTGILYAAAIAGGKQVAILTTDKEIVGPALKGKKVVIVDDVIHSGGRVTEAQKIIEHQGAVVVGFAVIIDRSNGNFGNQAIPLWSAHQTAME